jgi:hypothetical protein
MVKNEGEFLPPIAVLTEDSFTEDHTAEELRALKDGVIDVEAVIYVVDVIIVVVILPFIEAIPLHRGAILGVEERG